MSRAPDEPQIESLTSAQPGWYAVWRDDGGELLEPVAAWALVELNRPGFPGGSFP